MTYKRFKSIIHNFNLAIMTEKSKYLILSIFIFLFKI
jgi:hypothetical protein